ncbi:MAG: D-2-hydroxyacid dehydrogenase family protein [Proteobacteria bacterium]|nr:D-2-hydroxyacid dehydrogenase family protein [Pseudomonadota bacterium]
MADKTRIAILDDFQNVALEVADWSAVAERADIDVFNDHLADADAVAERLRDFDIVVIMRERTPFPAALIGNLPNLRLLVTTGMRNLSIDLDAATARGVIVSGTESVGYTPAELTWALILALMRDIPREDRATREGRWQTALGRAINGRVLGVIGLGKIGARVAAVGKAFEMDVIAWSQNLTGERCAEVGVRQVGFEELLTTSDVITIHTVLSDRTRGLIGAGELAKMKPTATLVNTSRGPVIEEAALITALKDGTIAGAGLDVYDVEPLPLDHPLRGLENTVITPHLGYVTDDNYRVYFDHAVDDIGAYLDGGPVRVLNPEVLEKTTA